MFKFKTYFSKEEVDKLINEVLEDIPSHMKCYDDFYCIENDSDEDDGILRWRIIVNKKEEDNGFLVCFNELIPFKIARIFNLPFEGWVLTHEKIYSRKDLKKIHESIVDGMYKTRKLIKEINKQEESWV